MNRLISFFIRLGTFIISFWVIATCATAQVFDYVIAQDGSGDYTTFDLALGRIPINQTERTLIFVKSGVYEEKVNFYSALKNYSLIGDTNGQVIIRWGDYSGDSEGHTTASSYTFETSADEFYVENITFENNAGAVGQAVAVSATGEHQIFKNCRFLGFQDTYYIRKGIQFNLDCYIEGATDFIFGESTAVFQNCEIRCLNGGQYITAPADTKLITDVEGNDFYHGTLFLNSQILAGTGVGSNSYYLGRPWQPNASSVYINCTYGDHIRDEGWSTWTGDNHLTGFFAEYNNQELSGTPVDVSARVDWSVQLDQQEVEDHYNLDYFLDGWDPLPLTQTLATPENLQRNIEEDEFFELTWDEVTGARGYVISKNDTAIGFTEGLSFIDGSSDAGDLYQVRSVSQTGALSGYSNEVEGVKVVLGFDHEIGLTIQGRMIQSIEPMEVNIYSVSGQLICHNERIRSVDMSDFRSGVYIVHLMDAENRLKVVKVAL